VRSADGIAGNADRDPARRAQTAAMAAFASSPGTTVIAGVRLGQGFPQGRPAGPGLAHLM
jgi:hypothetical protein